MALFARKKDVRRDALALAQGYPALLAEADRVAAIVAAGVHGRRRAGQGETFWQYRNYQSTDAASRIDWRRSARGDQIFVRDNEWEAANTVYLWPDTRPGMEWGSSQNVPTKADRGRVLTLAIANLLMKGGERCALMGGINFARSGRVGYERLAETLMRHEAGVDVLKSDVKAHSRLIITSDFLDPVEDWRSRLSGLAGRPVKGILVQIVDPAEEDFPFKGRVDMRAASGSLKYLLGRAETVKDAYQSRLAAHNARIANTAARLGWTLIRHRTDQPAARPLNAIYQALTGEM